MKKRIWSFLMALFLAAASVQVSIQAETESSGMQTESVVLTEENRYNPEFYREPEARYPVSKARVFEVTQEFETYILDKLKNFEEQIDIDSYQIPRGEAIPAFFQIVNSHPELFYLGTRVECYSTSGISRYFTVTYTDTPEEIRRQRREFEIAADRAAAQADSSMSDVEKALVVHDYLVQLCEYDKERYDNKSVPDISHSAYGALVNKIAVCDGYGKAYKYIMQDKLGIPCVLVTSDSMNHAWNMIQIGGNWYHVDATWADPVWDRIGRVVHKYFLLSDAAITNTAPGHSGWAADLKAESTDYDGAFWSDVDSAICPYQGEWYYSQYQDNKVNLVKKSGLFTGEPELVCTEPTWSAGENKYYPDSFMFLSKVNGQIYFNTNSAIKRLKADGTQETVYEPGLTEGQQIFWFTVRGGELCYALQAPESNVKQTILTYKLPELELPEISGVTAENATAVYDGTAKKISLNGAAESDIVWYAGEDGKFFKEQPELVDAGTYVVLYKVERTGYQTLYGSAELNIEKAAPRYTIPKGLTGYSGSPLVSVFLPSGFQWQTDRNTKLYREGIQKFLAKYMPADSKNYQSVADIEVEVAVKCPNAGSGHKYTSVVTKEPTETENGEIIKTCSVCGDVQTEEIPALKPEQQVPEYTVPTGLKGESGKTLGTVKLPEGFSWQSDPSTLLSREGTYAWEVKYTPEDTEKYQTVTDIEVEVTVECPGHQYESEVTKKPTETEKGERVSTCILCGDNFTEEIPMLKPGQQVPEYTVPTGLKGESGKTLGTVKLPEGFSWQSDPSTELKKEGTHTWKVIYTPEDTEQYQTVTDIEVEVIVECPGHQYESEVTKKPTETEKGERVSTCNLCGDRYTEEIPILRPGQQVPEYTAPTGLKGESGKTLGTVKLPEGFSWQSDPSTLLSREGTYVWKVKYTPEDTEKYETVTDIEVEVTVECPGHQYESEVTKKPTETEKGERVSTCNLCGDRYTEEIPMLKPGQQMPEYTVPTGLKGESGKTLGTVKLPEGFSWQSDPETKLRKEGTYVWKVKYTPADTEQYQTVTDIEVEVTVQCPGHQYESEVTKKPTETEKGERINTCSLCGDTYTEELSVLAPARPGSVSGLKVKKNMADSLTFSWRPVKNVSYRLMLYQGKKMISTQYVAGSVRSFGGLKAASNYTLKVTPYRIVDGTRIYAASTGELRTATAPSAVKLNAVKKSGKSKAKLTWKKVSGASGYEIFMKRGNGSYKKIKTISKGTATSFTKKGMKKGTYSFKIRAYKTVGRAKIRGGFSTVKKIKIR